MLLALGSLLSITGRLGLFGLFLRLLVGFNQREGISGRLKDGKKREESLFLFLPLPQGTSPAAACLLC